MRKSFDQRIVSSFYGQQGEAEAKQFSEKVYEAWKDVSVSLRRTALLSFLLIAAFELLIGQRSSASISIGTFTVASAPVVLTFLPTVVAFVLYDGFRLSVRWLRLQRAYRRLTKIFAPTQYDNDLDILIAPSLPSLWGIGNSVRSLKMANAGDVFMFFVNAAVTLTMMFVIPAGFECQAYYRLVQRFGFHDVFLWISLAITVALGASSAIYVWIVAFEPVARRDRLP
jgi:hypothetical protein